MKKQFITHYVKRDDDIANKCASFSIYCQQNNHDMPLKIRIRIETICYLKSYDVLLFD